MGDNMRRFTVEDYNEISTWYLSRNMTPVRQDFLPPVGFIVPGVAAGFIMQTDSNLAILEPFISNKESKSIERHEALDKIMAALVEYAKSTECKGIFGFSTSHPMIRRALRQGFIVNEINSSTVFKEL
jgi:hypothetical protein